MTTPRARLVVLISGGGSNLQALLDACERGHLDAEIVAVVSNRSDAYGLHRAKTHGIPIVIHATHAGYHRTAYDATLRDLVATFQPDWVILAGWLRLLSLTFLHHFPNKVINLHPALPGQFAGLHAIERAFEAAQRGEITETGVMIHLVPDEGVDDGPVLATQTVPIQANDTLDSLAQRIHQVEHTLIVDTIGQLISGERDNHEC